LKVYSNTWDDAKFFEVRGWGEEDAEKKERFAD
jgi:hypothetical protein